VPIKAKFASERVWRGPHSYEELLIAVGHGANLKPTLIPIPFAAWYGAGLVRGNASERSGHNMGSLIRVRRDPWRASSLSFPRIRARMLIAHGTFTSLDQF
jgi:hypothetical protein